MEFSSVKIWFSKTNVIGSLSLSRKKAIFSTLSKQEWQLYHSIICKQARKNYLLARLMVRIALSHYVDETDFINPAQWSFSIGKFGKPFVDNRLRKRLFYNVSHTEDIVVLAISNEFDVGIDIESVNRDFPNYKIENMLTQQQKKKLSVLSPAKKNYYKLQLWGVKEAIAKTVGQGLYMPFKDIECELDINTNPSSLCWEPAWVQLIQNVSFKYFILKEQYRVSVAVAVSLEKTPDESQPEISDFIELLLS